MNDMKTLLKGMFYKVVEHEEEKPKLKRKQSIPILDQQHRNENKESNKG